MDKIDEGCLTESVRDEMMKSMKEASPSPLVMKLLRGPNRETMMEASLGLEELK